MVSKLTAADRDLHGYKAQVQKVLDRDAAAAFTKKGLKFGKVFKWNGFAFSDSEDPENNPAKIIGIDKDDIGLRLKVR